MSECEWDCSHLDQVKRDQWGRPVVEGKPKTRVSTLVKALEDGTSLGMWKARRAVLGVCQPSALHLRERVLSSEGDEDVLREVVTEAMTLGGSKVAATRGTSLHDVIRLLNKGKHMPEGLSDSTRASAEAYMRTLDRCGIVPVLSEQFGVCKSWEAAGTADGTFEGPDGEHLIGDVKTGAKAWEQRYPLSLAMQLSAYAHSDRWCPVNGWLPTPKVELRRGLLISVPVDTGKCEVHVIDISRGVELLDLAVKVRRERRDQWQLNLGEME